MTSRSGFTPDEARAAGERIGIDWGSAPFDLEQFRMGMDVELEHGARDGRAGRLYVAAESGWVTVLQRHGQRLRVINSGYLANDAHIVTVDPATGRSYFPVLSASGGRPAVLVCELT